MSGVRSGIIIEWFSTGWMVIEAAVAIGAGVLAHSMVLVAFGADGVIEILSGSALLWRLYVQANDRSHEHVAKVEGVASWIAGVALLGLAVYIVADAIHSLVVHPAVGSSVGDLAIVAVSSVPMPLLSRAKKKIGRRIGSRALEADGSCSMVCAYMSWIALGGVVATALLGWWWLDSIAALALVYFVTHEGREAIEEASRRHTVLP